MGFLWLVCLAMRHSLRWNLLPTLFLFVAPDSFSFENNSNSSEGKSNGLLPFWKWTEPGVERCFPHPHFPQHLTSHHSKRCTWSKTTVSSSSMAGNGAGILEPRTKMQCMFFMVVIQSETFYSDITTKSSTYVLLTEDLDFSFQKYFRVYAKENNLSLNRPFLCSTSLFVPFP